MPAASADPASIDYFSSTHPLRRAATAVALRARRKIYRNFTAVLPPHPDHRVIDIGVTPDRALADSNFFEALYPWKERITATSIEDASFLEAQYPGLRFVRTGATGLPFADHQFDVAFCSAVLEHVGDRDQQAAFVAEMCRVARRFFLTTPDRRFPVEVHTFLPLVHWLPQRRHQAVLRAMGKPFWAETSNLNLCSPRTIRPLFPMGTSVNLRSFRTAGMPSNLIAWGESGSPVPTAPATPPPP